MQPYPQVLGNVGPGKLPGAGCLSARAMDTQFPTVVWRVRLGLPFSSTLLFWAGDGGVRALV